MPGRAKAAYRAAGAALALSLAAWLPASAHSQNQPGLSPTAQQQIRQLAASLPANSSFRRLLEHGVHGDGVRRRWMDRMRSEGVGLASFIFEFRWTKHGRLLGNWRVVSARYFSDYGQDHPITGSRRLEQIRSTGLGEQLEAIALSRAKRGDWFELPHRRRGTGYEEVFLADNQWLPVSWSSVSLHRYNRRTTPLMVAASFGDAGWVERLLREGARVNAVDSGGNTPLAYAAGSGSANTVDALLKAGASGRDAALVGAVIDADARMVEFLLKRGADPNSSYKGETVLSIAIKSHYADIARILRRWGAR